MTRPGPWSVLGAGAVASIGTGVAEFFDALCAGKQGLAPLRGFDPGNYRSTSAYEIDDRPGPGRDVAGRATSFLLAAITEALADAGLGDELGGEIPVLVGTGLRELRSAELWSRGLAECDPRRLHFGAALRERFGAVDTHTFANACSASLYALALGADLLAADEADTVVIAGVDTITESMFGLLDRVHPRPVDAVRPFDRDRRGVLMGDGAAAVVLARAGRPPAGPGGPAGRPRRAELAAVAVNCDAHHTTAPDRAGIVAAMRDAHARAGIDADAVDLVVAHGTGTLLNDETEADALREVFLADQGADGAGGPLVSAIKSMTGHTSGASGLQGLVVACEALRSSRVPPITGLFDPVEQAAGLRLVRGAPTAAEPMDVAQVEAFGFGGVNAVAIVRSAR